MPPAPPSALGPPEVGTFPWTDPLVPRASLRGPADLGGPHPAGGSGAAGYGWRGGKAGLGTYMDPKLESPHPEPFQDMSNSPPNVSRQSEAYWTQSQLTLC